MCFEKVFKLKRVCRRWSRSRSYSAFLLHPPVSAAQLTDILTDDSLQRATRHKHIAWHGSDSHTWVLSCMTDYISAQVWVTTYLSISGRSWTELVLLFHKAEDVAAVNLSDSEFHFHFLRRSVNFRKRWYIFKSACCNTFSRDVQTSDFWLFLLSRTLFMFRDHNFK